MPKINWVLLVLALGVSLIYGSHHFLMPVFLDDPGSAYLPLTVSSYSDVAMFYGPRANAVYWGEFRVGDMYLAEYRGGPALLPMLNPLILGWLGRIFGGTKNGFIAADFLFPPLIFIALYFLAQEITGERVFSTLFASVFIFSPKLFLYIPPLSLSAIKEFLVNFIPILAPPEALYFERFEYPKLTFLFYALAFYFTLCALKRREKTSIYLAGINFGILFYTYLYDWVYFFTGLGIMFACFMVMRDYDEMKITAKIEGIGLVISVFYWINFFQLNSLLQYHDIFLRIGAEISHRFRWASAWKSYLRNLMLIAFLWALFRRAGKITAVYLAALLLAYFAVVNVQVILGFNPHPDHWYRVEFLPIGLAVMYIAFWFYGKILRFVSMRWAVLCVAGFILLLFGQELYLQYNFSKASAKDFSLPKAEFAGYEWLNENTPKDSVVGVLSPKTNIELSLYTHNKIFLPGGGNSLAPTEEIWDRLMIMAKVFGVPPEELKSVVLEGNLYFFHDFYRDKSFDTYFRARSGQISEEEYKVKLDAYSGRFKDFQLSETPYQLDYLYFDPKTAGTWGRDPEKLINGLQKVYNDHIRIYKVSR